MGASSGNQIASANLPYLVSNSKSILAMPTPYSVKMPEAFHVIVMSPPFGVTGRPVTDVSM